MEELLKSNSLGTLLLVTQCLGVGAFSIMGFFFKRAVKSWDESHKLVTAMKDDVTIIKTQNEEWEKSIQMIPDMKTDIALLKAAIPKSRGLKNGVYQTKN